MINVAMFFVVIGALTSVCLFASSADGRLFDGLLEDASDKGCAFIAAHISDDGRYNISGSTEDLYSYFKLPLTLFTCGRLREANLVLDYIKCNFLQPDGDFKTSADLKSESPEASFLYTYSNVFIVLAAHRMERYDVAAPGLEYLQQYFTDFPSYGPPSEGYTATHPMTTANIGLLALTVGAAFLASYYRATGKEVYLKLAKNLLYFLGSCHENIYALKTTTQKFAVAASLVGTITGDRDINAMAERASAFLLDGLNEDGTFFDPAIRSPLIVEAQTIKYMGSEKTRRNKRTQRRLFLQVAKPLKYY
ncbi:hypothetical protein CAPTEDRAFT_216338 [Capitella teleta]|uniref:Alpha-macroglobulin-like TED domain-containing protein n=1 Tax=Capitella teleta TaxID=283909 RepID=R7TC06_CAPTE|nr:hypothetical protein CAPTEDRAFT_216338 [Capitella teleta]|eukprot:ELT88626.1 hypothetical protein CAPTEDRAFT_216338 [Capitella teleta]